MIVLIWDFLPWCEILQPTFGAMSKHPLIHKIEELRQFEGVLSEHLPSSVTAHIVPNGFHALADKCFVEVTANKKRLSNALFSEMFPTFTCGSPLYHYTSVDALRGIASSNEFQLHSLEKRFDEGELRQFSADHQLDGYLNSDEGEPYLKTLARDLFYMSFTKLAADESYHWDVFAKSGTGVRMKVTLSPKHCDLRAIKYAFSKRTLLSDLNKTLVAKKLLPFLPWSISKIGAFYLTSSLRNEDEVRLLIKRYPGGRNDAVESDRFEYWPLAVGANDFCDFDISAIRVGPQCSKSDVLSALEGTPLASVPVS